MIDMHVSATYSEDILVRLDSPFPLLNEGDCFPKYLALENKTHKHHEPGQERLGRAFRIGG